MARYTPGNVADPQVQNELGKVAQAMETADAMLNLEVLYAAPNKYREGSIVLADGTTWDPGSGKGVYCFYDGVWNFLG